VFIKFVIVFLTIISLSRSLHQQRRLPTILSAINPGEGDLDDRRKAKEEFEKFVRDTYQHLYRMESKTIGGRSSIAIFCRLDIGLVFNGTLHYFVNEVERSPSASLWANREKNSGSNPIGIFGASFGKSLHKWLTEIDDAYALF